jgi:hypothetical protein
MASQGGESQKHSEEIQGTSFAVHHFSNSLEIDVLPEHNWKMTLSQQLLPLLWKEECLENTDEVSDLSFLLFVTISFTKTDDK